MGASKCVDCIKTPWILRKARVWTNYVNKNSLKIGFLPWPGFEPGLLRFSSQRFPQRRVLTTRLSRLCNFTASASQSLWACSRKSTVFLSSTQKTGVFSETQIAAKPEELEPWEWSHSTALTTLIMVLLLFFSRRYFNISATDKILGRVAAARTTKMEYRTKMTVASHTGNWTRASWVRARYPNH